MSMSSLVSDVGFLKVELHFLMGEWESLTSITEDDLQGFPESGEVALLVAIAHMQKLDYESSIFFLQHARQSGISKEKMAKKILTGIAQNLGFSNIIFGNISEAERFYAKGSNENPSLAKVRLYDAYSKTGSPKIWCHSKRNNKLFVDCGGYDGCSVIKFLLSHPDYDVVTFEANPDLWNYYHNLPTKLEKKAVAAYQGKANFVIDPIDADGSSLVQGKKVVCGGRVDNKDCPNITVETVDLSNFITEKSSEYDEIVLKLDVEGAEYEILDKMINEGTLRHVNKLYCEFHHEKINMPYNEHVDILKRMFLQIDAKNVLPWDAEEFSIHRGTKYAVKLRPALLEIIRNQKKLYS
ncbi:FkbM family methyltransferase [Halomonas desiderata]|uniref:FkbM family methyltransferase n=1 Tax=Billgrantia desiderata TaxID=52021 RepID=UPI0017489267|nr:FkbM family methyltransferase [Halomonas desiderata]